jgi:hypothetical protein
MKTGQQKEDSHIKDIGLSHRPDLHGLIKTKYGNGIDHRSANKIMVNFSLENYYGSLPEL